MGSRLWHGNRAATGPTHPVTYAILSAAHLSNAARCAYPQLYVQRDLLRDKSCTYDTSCCGKGFVHSVGVMDDRAMSACVDRSSGPGLPLPVFCASIALALILDGLHLGPSRIVGISLTLKRSGYEWNTQATPPFSAVINIMRDKVTTPERTLPPGGIFGLQ